MAQELITMTNRELRKHQITKNLINRKINGPDASKQSGLSIRRVKNLKSKARERIIERIFKAYGTGWLKN